MSKIIANCSMILTLLIVISTGFQAAAHSPEFTDTFMQERCTFLTTGSNPYFKLVPGFELVLQGVDEGDNVELVITVLDETKEVDGVETRIVRERETINGELVEISRNYFAICKQTNSVFYFGEAVNFYEDGVVVSHDGSWRAGVNGARAGILIPGTHLIGARHYQEVAPEVAEDRAEIMAVDAEVSTPFDTFTDCLKVKETTPLEPDALEFKFYGRGIGLIKDGPLELVRVTTPAGTFYPE